MPSEKKFPQLRRVFAFPRTKLTLVCAVRKKRNQNARRHGKHLRLWLTAKNRRVLWFSWKWEKVNLHGIGGVDGKWSMSRANPSVTSAMRWGWSIILRLLTHEKNYSRKIVSDCQISLCGWLLLRLGWRRWLSCVRAISFKMKVSSVK